MKTILERCESCEGTGEVECCRSHMCPGTKKCFDCDGKGKVLTAKYKKLKNKLLKLMEYK